MNIFDKIASFLGEVRMEIKKVNWPTRSETLRYTLIVIGISVATAIFLGGIDFGFTTAINKFLIK
jgi:preprotein translocase subunit SecE